LKSKLNKISKQLLINALILSCLVFIVEGVFRLKNYLPYQSTPPNVTVSPSGGFYDKDSLLGYKHKPGKFDVKLKKNFSFSINHDTLGLRITQSQKDSLMRPEIWIMGCSFTHGWSVNDEETFPWIIQSKLKKHKIVNWGTSGYGTIHFYLQLKKALEKGVQPEIVVLNHANFHFDRNVFSYFRRRVVSSSNHLGDLNQPFGIIDTDGELIINQSKVIYNPWPLARKLALVFYLQNKIEDFRDQSKNDQQVTTLLLKKIVELCKQKNIQLLITNIWDDKTYIEEFSSTYQIPFVNLAVDLNKKEFTNRPFDSHPSAMAHQEYAKKLLDFITVRFLKSTPERCKELPY
jgi:hypothetical protein